MNIRLKAFLLLVFFLISAGILITLLFNYQPSSSTLPIFYGTLTIFLTSSLIIVLCLTDFFKHGNLPTQDSQRRIFRLSALISVIAVGSLILQSYKLLTVINFLVVVCAVAILNLVLRQNKLLRL